MQFPSSCKSRKTLLFCDAKSWVKEDDENDFDVPMGCYDGIDVWELVGTYLLSELKVAITIENIGLHRDDGLFLFKKMSRSEVERKKKQLVKIFKNNGLSITVKTIVKQ